MQILQNCHSQERRGEQAGWAALAPIPGVTPRALGTQAGTVSRSSRELWWQWPHMASPNITGDNHRFIWYQEIHTYLLVWLRRKCGISVWKGRRKRKRRRKGAVGRECWIIPKCENPSAAIKRKLSIHHNHPDSTWQYHFMQTTAEDKGLSTSRTTLIFSWATLLHHSPTLRINPLPCSSTKYSNAHFRQWFNDYLEPCSWLT